MVEVRVKAEVAVWVGEPLSVSLTVKLAVVWEVGVPVMMPVVLERERPEGSAPAVIDQV
jgi:hypothetical protein